MARTPIAPIVSSLAVSLLVLASPIPVVAQTVVTTCGQEASGSATLNADLDCTGFDGYAVTMHGGTLTMNGHTITGGSIGIQCDRTCKIVGPGTVTASTFVGVNAFNVGLKMSQVDVTDCGYFGAQVWHSAAIEGPAVFSGNGGAIRVGAKAKIKDVTITGNGAGVDAENNAKTGSIQVQLSTISGNSGTALRAQRGITVTDSTVMDNGESGVFAAGGYCEKNAGASITRSTVTGNGTAPGCGSNRVCADVATCKRRPRVKEGSTCGTSHQIESGNPGSDWDVCTLD
jgi:hypothetical protein